jgi:pyruvate,water dikinase
MTTFPSIRRTCWGIERCGQGPSDLPDFAQFLVELGIDSISVTPDSLLKTKRAIAEVEKAMAGKNGVKA